MKRLFLITFLILIIFSTVSYAAVEVPETVRIKLNDGSIIEVDFDEYLYGVVTSEMGTSYKADGEVKEVGIEALKAQAIASRTYALYTINTSKSDEYDLTASTSDQVYKAVNAKDIVKEAVDSTSGQVITYNGELISSFFFSTSGGHTEAPENVWSSSLPYLIGVDDPYEPFIEGKSTWEARIPKSKYGEIEILERSVNDRVTKLQVGDEVLTKNNIRTKLGASFIKSTWFDLEYDSSTQEYVFVGKGYGHGVGMSQYGAMGMAEEGFDCEEILKWYYTDVEITDSDYIYDNNYNTEDNVDDDKFEQFDNTNVVVAGNYSDLNPSIDGKSVEYGPMLKSILSMINAWG